MNNYKFLNFLYYKIKTTVAEAATVVKIRIGNGLFKSRSVSVDVQIQDTALSSAGHGSISDAVE